MQRWGGWGLGVGGGGGGGGWGGVGGGGWGGGGGGGGGGRLMQTPKLKRYWDILLKRDVYLLTQVQYVRADTFGRL